MSDATFKVQDENVKLGYWTKFSYGIGDLASNLSWGLVGSYLLYFYTDVYGLTAGVITTLMIIARGWDAFIDPVIGLITERTQTKWGRFRPYVLFGAVLLCVFNILTFTVPSLSGTSKIIYAGVTYLLLGTVYSIVNVPYGALATVMTRDTEERTSLNSFRGFFSLISNVITGALVMPLVLHIGQGNNAKGFQGAAIVLSLISLPMFAMVFLKCKETITPPKSAHPKMKDSLNAVIKNKPLALALTHLFLVFTGLFSRLGVVIYFYIYNMNRPDLIGPLMMIFGVSTAAGAIIVGFIGKYFEKRTISIVGMTISAIGHFAIFLCPVTNIPAIIGLTVLSCVPLGFGSPIIFSMVGDCIDHFQVQTGTRADGAIYSFTSFITKVSMALIGALSVEALSMIGYVANKPQTAETLKGLNGLVNLVPAVIFLLSTIPLYFYDLSKDKANKNSQELRNRELNETV